VPSADCCAGDVLQALHQQHEQARLRPHLIPGVALFELVSEQAQLVARTSAGHMPQRRHDGKNGKHAGDTSPERDPHQSPAAPLSTPAPLPGVRKRTQAKSARQTSTALAMEAARNGRLSAVSSKKPERIGLGTRILIRAFDSDGKQLLRTGVVRFEGKTMFAKGQWVGIELTCATGKNDGAVKGQRYFQCRRNHGVFVRPHMVVVPQSDEGGHGKSHSSVEGRAFGRFSWDDLLIAEVQGRGVITLDGDDVADSDDSDHNVSNDLTEIADTIARLSSSKPPRPNNAKSTKRLTAPAKYAKQPPSSPSSDFLFMQQDNFLRRAATASTQKKSRHRIRSPSHATSVDSNIELNSDSEPNREGERQRAEELLRDGKRLLKEGLLSQEDFDEIKHRALSAFMWQRGGSSPNGQRRAPPTLSSLTRASSTTPKTRLARRRDEIAQALRDAEGPTTQLPPGTEGCCPMGHRLKPYMPPKSLMSHFPTSNIHFAKDGTTAQQVALQATREHVLAFGHDYSRDWDFLTLPNCSSCGAELHGGQVCWHV